MVHIFVTYAKKIGEKILSGNLRLGIFVLFETLISYFPNLLFK